MLETAMQDQPDNAIHLTTRAEWRAWLEQHHARPEGVWLISSKKATGKPRVAYEEAVEEALCFGWIDSIQRTLDDERAMLWFAPRKPRTGWSKLNKQRIERLTAAGLMAPAGLAKIEAARQDGSWSALDVDCEHKDPSHPREAGRGDRPAGRGEYPRQPVAPLSLITRRLPRQVTLRVQTRCER